MTEKYHFFFGKDSPLSNFHTAPFVDEEERRFFCSEQYMMFHKALLFKDDKIAQTIFAEQSSPRRCKQLGRKVKNFDQDTWKEYAKSIVEAGVYLKFSQNQEIADFLMSLHGVEIVEASPYDRIWGIGYSANSALTVSKEQWGTNWLGLVLMRVRDRLIAEVNLEDATDESSITR